MRSRTRHSLLAVVVALLVLVGILLWRTTTASWKAARPVSGGNAAKLESPPQPAPAPPPANAPAPQNPAPPPPAVTKARTNPPPQPHPTRRAERRISRPPIIVGAAPPGAGSGAQSAHQAFEQAERQQQQQMQRSQQAHVRAYAMPPPPPPPVALSPPEPAPPPEPPVVTMAAPATVAPLESRESNGIVDMRVFYATDRNPTGSGVKGATFGPAQAPNGQLSYGSLIVSIPPNHVTGELESPMFHLKFLENPAKHIVLECVTPESESGFFADLHGTVASAPRKEVLIFIHGFDTTFEDAARRTAQLTYDLQFTGAPIVYSWPSRGLPTPGSYGADAKNAKWTAAHLMQFLMDVRAQSGATSIHVIAHSMGSRALLDALDKMRDPKALHLGEVVLAAPDLPTARFIQDVPRLQGVADRITLYASSRDEALELSQHFNHKPRAGESASLSIVPPAETIDASAVDTGFLGHSYFGDSVLVLKDMVYLIRDGLPAAKRSHLREGFLGPNAYWIFFP